MKVTFEILYKSGHIDVIEQEITDENIKGLEEVEKSIDVSMKGEGDGFITLGDGETEGYKIRLSDISRVKATHFEEKGE